MEVLLLFPGQGSQKPGMAQDLVEGFAAARDVWQRADDALESPLSALAFGGPAELLTRTDNAQPALLAHAAAVWAVTREKLAPLVRGAAGHSLGEFSAYYTASALPLDDALKLVRRRGELMQQAATRRTGVMAAILGELQRPIEDVCLEASAAGVVVPANYNSELEVVVSGDISGVEKAMELAKQAGARRTVFLNVSGAFHSPLMAPASEGLDIALSVVRWSDPSFPVYSNVTAKRVGHATLARELLLKQLTSPVRWVEVVRAMAGEHPGALFVEMGPGSVLTRLVKRLAPEHSAVSCGTAAEVESLLTQVS